MTSNNLIKFLPTVGLELSADGHTHLLNESTQSENFISILSHYGLLAINGLDAAKFLQGQTTCDVNSIDIETSCPGAYCTPKGRMLTSFLLAQQGKQSYLMRMRHPLVETTNNVLSKYIVFSKAEQHSANDDYIAVGLFGDKAKAAIHNVFGQVPSQRYQCINMDGNIAIQIDTEGLMIECWIKTGDLKKFWPSLSDNMSLQGSKHWELLTIRLGIGEVCAETVDMFIPQMLNYHLTEAISFTKGCYTGQEIVARMQYRGKLKRGMYRIKTANKSFLPGTELYLSSNSDQSIGNIVNAINIETIGSEALAVLTHSVINQDNIFIGDDKSPVEILSLPYTVPIEIN
jgi:folate-binding protein YgfZ